MAPGTAFQSKDCSFQADDVFVLGFENNLVPGAKSQPPADVARFGKVEFRNDLTFGEEWIEDVLIFRG